MRADSVGPPDKDQRKYRLSGVHRLHRHTCRAVPLGALWRLARKVHSDRCALPGLSATDPSQPL